MLWVGWVGDQEAEEVVVQAMATLQKRVPGVLWVGAVGGWVQVCRAGLLPTCTNSRHPWLAIFYHTYPLLVPSPHPPSRAAFEDVTPEQLAVRCLRKRHYLRDDVLGAALAWFNALCVDDFDLPAFREWQRAAAEAQAAAAAGGAAAEPSGGGDVAARAAATAAAAKERAAGGDEQQPEDFYSLQQEFYKEQEVGGGGKAAGQEEPPTATER